MLSQLKLLFIAFRMVLMNLQTMFISNVKRIRKQKHITQEKLAEKWVLVCKAFQVSN